MNLYESINNNLKEGVDWDYFDKFEGIVDKYMSSQGEGETLATQIVTAINKLIYKWYNDGDVYDNVNSGMEGWANDLSSYANWLNKYCDRARSILDVIYQCSTNDKYEGLLKSLADNCLDEKYLEDMNKKEKQGSIYKCDGPFKFSENQGDDDYEDEPEDDEDYEESDKSEMSYSELCDSALIMAKNVIRRLSPDKNNPMNIEAKIIDSRDGNNKILYLKVYYESDGSFFAGVSVPIELNMTIDELKDAVYKGVEKARVHYNSMKDEEAEGITESEGKVKLQVMNRIPDDNFRIYYKDGEGNLYCDLLGDMYDCTAEGEPIDVVDKEKFIFEDEHDLSKDLFGDEVEKRNNERKESIRKNLILARHLLNGETILDPVDKSELDLDTVKVWLKNDYVRLNNLLSADPDEINEKLAQEFPDIFGNDVKEGEEPEALPEPEEVEDEDEPKIDTKEEAIDFLKADEEEAISGYEKVLERLKDYGLDDEELEKYTKVLNHIIDEEKEHIEELTKLLNGEPVDITDVPEE